MYDLDNAVAACLRCNTSKSDRDEPRRFFGKQSHRRVPPTAFLSPTSRVSPLSPFPNPFEAGS